MTRVGNKSNLLKIIFGKFPLIYKKFVDLFGGSGTTLMASEQTGRRCYMMEYDPYYVDIIIDRWENFTGRKAVKIS